MEYKGFLIKTPICIGSGRGFLIDKTKIRLKANKRYKILIYELDDFIDALSLYNSDNKKDFGGFENGL